MSTEKRKKSILKSKSLKANLKKKLGIKENKEGLLKAVVKYEKILKNVEPDIQNKEEYMVTSLF